MGLSSCESCNDFLFEVPFETWPEEGVSCSSPKNQSKRLGPIFTLVPIFTSLTRLGLPLVSGQKDASDSKAAAAAAPSAQQAGGAGRRSPQFHVPCLGDFLFQVCESVLGPDLCGLDE